MTMPNFFIIGAQKSGTTSLCNYLKQHPQVYMSPVKEPFFFNHKLNSEGEVVKDEFRSPIGRPPLKSLNLEEYRTLFGGANGEKAIGEASPLYIHAPGTAERIKRYVPEAKVIAILRNPADRAYSSFLHAIRNGVEPLNDFARALREEEDRIRNNWPFAFHYRARGVYHAQLKPYYELFGRERVGVWLYEDLRADPVSVTKSVFRFLEVDDAFTPDTSSKHNPAGVPKNDITRAMMNAMHRAGSAFRRTVPPTSNLYPLAARMRERFQRRILAKPPAIDPEIRQELIEGYREEILRLQDLLRLDLSVWLEQNESKTTREAVPERTSSL